MPSIAGRPVASLLRYGMAMTGSISSAGAQFILSLALLRTLDQAAFGRFSFLLVSSQLSWGIWSALLCAPLPILLASGDARVRAALLRCVLAVNLFGAAVAFGLFLAAGLLLGQSLATALLFAGYAAVALLRWFGRAYGYANDTPVRTIASDLAYSGTLLAGAALLLMSNRGSPELAYAALLASAIVGLLPFGRVYLAQQFGSVSLRATAGYAAVWREHSRWSLLGVLTTEATANAHAYIVTLLLGAAAFAPISASALMIRPINVAMNALGDYERAQMGRQIADGRIDAALRAVRFFRAVLIAIWLATALFIAGVLRFRPQLIFPPRYDLHFLAVGTALWMAVGAVRLLRTPDSALLQAAGAFRPLAFASVWSSGVSVVAVLVLLVASGPLWSIVGILAGEAVFAGFIWRQAGRWVRGARGGASVLAARG